MTEIKWQITLGAILCITALEVVALLKGVNGTILTMVVAAIAGIAGYTIKAKSLNSKSS